MSCAFCGASPPLAASPQLASRSRRAAPLRALATESSSGSLSDFESFVRAEQQRLCAEYEALDGGGARFLVDAWSRAASAAAPSASSGVTRVLSGGSLFEKAAVNVSVVRGRLSAARAAALAARGRPACREGAQYEAAALSLVLHPASPYVPTFRADVRAFSVAGEAWVGGGCDLTPAYLFEEDAARFHAGLAALCAAHEAPSTPPGELYRDLKRATDAYFYLPARAERRGLGGVFFDDFPLRAGGPPAAGAAPRDGGGFARALAAAWLPLYAPICEARRGMEFGEAQRAWQLQRRGRYVEFNLLYDRGVRFGLDGGRVESIMVSAPPLVRWDYEAVPGEGSHEARTLAALRGEARNWVVEGEGRIGIYGDPGHVFYRS